LDTLIEVLPTNISVNQNGPHGRREMEITGVVKGSIEQHAVQDLLSGKLKLVAVTERERAFLSANSNKLTLILQEVLELKELIKNKK
jgi:hypothetical protein